MFGKEDYESYIGKGWYDNAFSQAQFNNWCKNFNDTNPVEDTCSELLMHALVFYQEKQQVAIIESIKQKIYSHVNISCEQTYGRRLQSAELQKEISRYVSESAVFTISGSNNASDGSHVVARLWEERNGLWGSVSEIFSMMSKIRNNIHHVFFLDDFIGTGSRFCEFLENKISFEDEPIKHSVSSIISNYKDSVDFNVVTLCIHSKGMDRIKDKHDFKFYYGDFYNYMYDLTNEDCVFYKVKPFGEQKKEIIDYIKKKQKDLDPDNEFALFLPVAFKHGCPNNSLSLYYSRRNNWRALVKPSHVND